MALESIASPESPLATHVAKTQPDFHMFVRMCVRNVFWMPCAKTATVESTAAAAENDKSYLMWGLAVIGQATGPADFLAASCG
jgi:hypothetical protein